MLTRQPKENVFKVTLILCYEQKGFFVEALCVTNIGFQGWGGGQWEKVLNTWYHSVGGGVGRNFFAQAMY